jgi:hypothetical protein
LTPQHFIYTIGGGHANKESNYHLILLTMDKEEIKDSLSEFELSQPFTIEHLVRKMGEREVKNGLGHLK